MYSKKDQLKVGEWVTVAPEGAVNAFEGDWHGYVKKGSVNKLIVCFWGGGVAIDDYSITHPTDFFTTWVTSLEEQQYGIISPDENNPFKDWSYFMLPYSTGDFHAGAGEYIVKDENGNSRTIRFNGYKNYRGFMDLAVEYLDCKPDALLITGFSAGGFATGLLSNDVITNYFPDVENTVALDDSGIMHFKDSKNLAENIWHTPKEISDRIVTDDIILDSYKALSKDHPNTKLLFTMSTRDAIIAVYQGYVRDGNRDPSKEQGDRMFEVVKEFTEGFVALPNSSAFIWNDKLVDYFPAEFELTDHTIEFCERVYTAKHGDEQKTIAEWILDCFNGDMTSHGLNLIK